LTDEVEVAPSGAAVGLVTGAGDRLVDEVPLPFFALRGDDLCCGCAIEFPSRLKKSPIGLPANDDDVTETQKTQTAATMLFPMLLWTESWNETPRKMDRAA
jgi:hypothetical protein